MRSGGGTGGSLGARFLAIDICMRYIYRSRNRGTSSEKGGGEVE